jgi:hypothetical protein
VPTPYENRSGQEGSRLPGAQRKIGLETPLVGRFWGENKRLVFAPPAWYQTLVLCCLVGGGVLFLAALFSWEAVPFFGIGLWLGPALFLSGVWAALSMEYVVFDLRARTYLRREGQGFYKRTRRGSTAEVDAVVVYAEEYPFSMVARAVVYRTVVHWKHAAVPLLQAEREMVSLPSGAPINHSSAAIVARAHRYAQALEVKFFDNSYFHSPAPQAPI